MNICVCETNSNYTKARVTSFPLTSIFLPSALGWMNSCKMYRSACSVWLACFGVGGWVGEIDLISCIRYLFIVETSCIYNVNK